MFRSLAFLVGTAVLAALLAGVYYSPANYQSRTDGYPAFNLAPGEVRQDGIQPAVPDSPVAIQIEVLSGEVDIYVMDKEWAGSLPRDGALRLDHAFSYYEAWSATHVNTSHEITIISDGLTWYSIIFDNSDNFYDGDAEPGNDTANLRVTVRYLEQEERSLVLGYIAAVPSVLLVVVTMGRKYARWKREKRDA